MYRLLLVSITVVVLAITGWISGLWTDRWTSYPEKEIAAAGAKLEKIPLTLDKWDGRDIVADPKTLPEELIGRNIVRRYVNRNNGMIVDILLSCGPTKPMWYGHLPTECYPSAGYTVSGSPSKQLVAVDPQSVPASFRVATFSRDETAAPVYVRRVFWCWSGDGSWQAPDKPHRAFAHPFLYKLYIIRRLLDKEDEPLDRDPCAEFARVFLPELTRTLF